MKKLTASLLVLFTIVALLPSCKKFIENKVPKVEAGDNVTTKMPADSVHLAGFATVNDKGTFISSYEWKKISGPGSPVFSHPDSSSTWVRDLEVGTYKFKLTATDNFGVFGSDTVSVVVLPEGIEFVAQPTNNFWEVHLFGNTNGIDQTHREATEIGAASGTYFGDPVDIHALLKFDLSAIPADAEILSARLKLYSHPDPLNGNDQYPNYGPDNTMLIQRVNQEWDYQTVNWLNQPSGATEDQVEVPHTNEHFLDLDVDVKDLVSTMIAEGNNGFKLKLKTETEYNFRIFVSSKNVDFEAKRPKLEVVYQ